MSELATLRWGDTQQAIVPNSTDNNPTFNFTSKQLVNAKWHVPMSWNVILFGLPILNSDETATFTVTWLITIGCGQAASTEVPLFTMSFAPSGGKYSLQQQQQLIPAEVLMIRVQAAGNQFTIKSKESFVFGAFVAPNNSEPFAEQDMLERMYDSGLGQQGEATRFMADMGFDDDPLRYQPYRRRRG